MTQKEFEAALETPGYAEIQKTMAAMGYALRLQHRKVGREAGYTTKMPAIGPIYFMGRPYGGGEEDLTVLLPGEEP